MNMKERLIIILTVSIVFSGIFYYYHGKVLEATSYSIFVNLDSTQVALARLDKDLDNSDSMEELSKAVLPYRRSLIFNTHNTEKYQQIDFRYEYLNVDDLSLYFQLFIGFDEEPENFELHKANLKEICKVWKDLEIKPSSNFLAPSSELKNALETTRDLSRKGYAKF